MLKAEKPPGVPAAKNTSVEAERLRQTKRIFALLLAAALLAGSLCTGAGAYVDPAAPLGSITVENGTARIRANDDFENVIVDFSSVTPGGTLEIQGENDAAPVTLQVLLVEPDCKITGSDGVGHLLANLYVIHEDGRIEGPVYSEADMHGYGADFFAPYIWEDGTFYLITYALEEGRYWFTDLETIALLQERTGLKPTGAAFTDVPADAYYAEAVAWAVEQGVTTGTTTTTFSPADTVTRSQAVTFLWRAAGEPAPKGSASPFRDVQDSGAYYYKAVLWAAEQGITIGVGDGYYGTEETLSYEQILTFLCRAAGADASGDDWSDKAQAWAAAQGITAGLSFVDTAGCPRSDVVYCLWKLLSVGEIDPKPPVEEEPSVQGPTAEQVYSSILALKTDYPEGMHWTNDDYYRSEAMGRGGFGCEAFALICSDAAFGDLPVETYFPEAYPQLYDRIRVGDMIRINEAHTVVVLEKYDDHIVITEGNYNSSIHWGRTITRSSLENSYFWVRSRYPAA